MNISFQKGIVLIIISFCFYESCFFLGVYANDF